MNQRAANGSRGGRGKRTSLIEECVAADKSGDRDAIPDRPRRDDISRESIGGHVGEHGGRRCPHLRLTSNRRGSRCVSGEIAGLRVRGCAKAKGIAYP